MFKRILIKTAFVSFGDQLYQTPLVRYLRSQRKEIHIWTANPEPWLGNPNVSGLYRYMQDSTIVPLAIEFFHPRNIFELKAEPHINFMHSVDYHTMSMRFTLPPKQKTLEFYWTTEDEERVDKLLEGRTDYVCINPTITWPSRTLPFSHYLELSERFLKEKTPVILTGKSLNLGDFGAAAGHLKATEHKGVYPTDSFSKKCLNLVGKLSFAELGYLYSKAKVVVNTENGHHVLTSAVGDKPWNLYISSLMMPEYRLPFRHGSMYWKTVVIENPSGTYSGSTPIASTQPSFDLPIYIPPVDEIWDGYLKIKKAIKNNQNEIYQPQTYRF